jgi:molybdopterin converting factor small subunit
MAIVTLRYWAAAKEAAGVGEETITAGTLAEALAVARGQHPARGARGEPTGDQAQPPPRDATGATAGDSGSATHDDSGSATHDDSGSATHDDSGSATHDDSGSATAGDSGSAPARGAGQNPRLRDVLARSSFLIDGVPVGVRAPETVTLSDAAVIEVLPPFAGG